jgi:NAD(P)H dehydrogenase (quinone)
MQIAITGASGQFGRAAVEGLMARMPASDLILISRRPEKLSAFAAHGAQCRRGDFDEPESLVPALAGAERMLLISATRVGKRVAQHKAAIDAAVRAGVKHIVYTSLVGATAPGNPALVAHDHGPTEDLIKASGLNWTILRDAQYSDAVADVIAPGAIATGQWISSCGEGRMPFVARADCVACAVAVLAGEGHAGKTYNLTGPDMLTFREAAKILAEVSGEPIEYVETDDEGMYAAFDALGVPRQPVDDLVVGGNPWCSDDMVTFAASIRGRFFEVESSDVERLLGRRPRSLREMLVERLRG